MTVHSAETLFRWLMRAYPARFRRAHGLALFELFRDEAREAHRARGTRGLLTVLAKTAADTLKAAPGVWIRRGPTRPTQLTLSTGPTGPTGPSRPAWPTLRASRFRLRAPRYGGQVGGQAPPFLDLSGWVQDVRIAVRHLRKSPGFAIVAIAMLAVGIGANTTIFSLMNAVLLHPLAAHEPDRIVRIVARVGTGAAGAAARRFSFRDYADYRERTTTLDDLSGVNLATLLLTADNRTDQLIGEIASARYLSLRGIRVSQGRLLTDADDRPAAPPVAVISDALWRRRFGVEPVVGRQVLMNRSTYTIVGVADPSAIGSFIGAPVDVWLPIGSSGTALGSRWDIDRSQRTLALIGRLRPGVTREQARGELQLIANAIAREFTPELHPIIDVLPGTLATGDQRRLAQMFLSLLLGLVALVLVIACANVGNLLLARVLGRRRELAIRVALGATRWRLARMLAIEGALIAAAGGAGALGLSWWTARALANISPLPTLTLRLDVRSDARVFAFTVLAALAAAAILALVGTLQAMNPDITPALKEDATASIGGRRPARMRAALATMQITVSLLLVIGAALFVRSVREAAAIDLGFDPRGVVVLDVDASAGRTNAESLRLFQDVLRRVERLQSITAAAVSTRAPLDSSTPLIHVNAHEPIATAGENTSPEASFMVVSPRYFDVVKTPLVSGRAFAETDDADRPSVAIINETLAAHLWPLDPSRASGSSRAESRDDSAQGAGAVGRRVWLEAAATTGIRDENVRGSVPCIVVGVARDSKYRTLGEQRQGHVYLPFAQQPRRGMAILVRATDPPDRIASAVQTVLRTADPNLQGFFTRTLTEHVAVSTLPVRLAAGLAIGMAALALALSLVGLYSLVSFLVAERTHEIGLRKALGADTMAVLRLVAGYGVKVALWGLAVGIPAAIASTRLLRGLLYGVSPTDPLVFVGVSAAMLAVAIAACCVPARRAMRLDPLVALRSE
jgi:predicted permease